MAKRTAAWEMSCLNSEWATSQLMPEAIHCSYHLHSGADNLGMYVKNLFALGKAWSRVRAVL